MSTIGPEYSEDRGAHLDDETIAAFVEDSVDTEMREQVQEHLQKCLRCFESVARLRKSLAERETQTFLSTPEEFLREAKRLAVRPEGALADALRRTVQKVPEMISSASVLKQRLPRIGEIALGWRIAIPTVTLAAAVLLVLVLRHMPTIQNYAMGDRLVISEMGPLGFAGKQEVRKYKGMRVLLREDEGKLIFTWPEVAGAEFYHVALILNGKDQRVTPPQGAKETTFAYPLPDMKMNTRYIWQISGKLSDGRSFRARAGFVWRDRR